MPPENIQNWIELENSSSISDKDIESLEDAYNLMKTREIIDHNLEFKKDGNQIYYFETIEFLFSSIEAQSYEAALEHRTVIYNNSIFLIILDSILLAIYFLRSNKPKVLS